MKAKRPSPKPIFVIYVDTKGEASYRLKARMRVGPVLSRDMNGIYFFIIGMSLSEIKELGSYNFQQLQISDLRASS